MRVTAVYNYHYHDRLLVHFEKHGTFRFASSSFSSAVFVSAVVYESATPYTSLGTFFLPSILRSFRFRQFVYESATPYTSLGTFFLPSIQSPPILHQSPTYACTYFTPQRGSCIHVPIAHFSFR